MRSAYIVILFLLPFALQAMQSVTQKYYDHNNFQSKEDYRQRRRKATIEYLRLQQNLKKICTQQHELMQAITMYEEEKKRLQRNLIKNFFIIGSNISFNCLGAWLLLKEAFKLKRNEKVNLNYVRFATCCLILGLGQLYVFD